MTQAKFLIYKKLGLSKKEPHLLYFILICHLKEKLSEEKSNLTENSILHNIIVEGKYIDLRSYLYFRVTSIYYALVEEFGFLVLFQLSKTLEKKNKLKMYFLTL